MIILDTNVTSELTRTSPAPAVLAWARACPASERFTTAISLAEIRFGIGRLPDGRRRDELDELARQVFSAFPAQVLSFDAAAALEYATIVGSRQRSGSPIDVFDAQIASICRVRGATLATRNGRDFRGTGISVIDPWTHQEQR